MGVPSDLFTMAKKEKENRETKRDSTVDTMVDYVCVHPLLQSLVVDR